MDKGADHTLEFLLDFDGRIHSLEQGYWIKFEIKRAEASAAKPHGLSYCFTLHAPDGTRLIGFDNAHAVTKAGSRYKKQTKTNDHWHRSSTDIRPYEFQDADALLQDFFREVRRVLGEHGVSETVVREGDK